MIRRSLPLVFAASVLLSGLASPPLAGAQPLGTFRWQLHPYCTVLTVSVVQQGGHYLLDGTADEVAPPRGPASAGWRSSTRTARSGSA